MQNLSLGKSNNNIAQSGFTLVELVLVLILLGILSVYAVPRMFTTDGFSEFATQQRLISALRTIQIKSMQDTSSNYCYRVIFDTSATPAIGPSVAAYVDGNQALSCGNTIDANASEYLRISEAEFSEFNLSLFASDDGAAISYLEFNSLGQPLSSGGRCVNACRISLSGQSTTHVCIESEGYVHAC